MTARLLLALLLAVPTLASAQAGRFLLAVGDVVLARGAAEVRAAPGTAVESGDTIRVGPNSSAQVRFTDESVVSLRAGTVFRVDTYEFSGGSGRSFFSLLKGGFRTVTGLIGRLHSKERYQVRTATSTIGIRGTHYTVVHCAGDCARGVADGTYGGVSDGRIGVDNQAASVEFGANEFFHVASANSAPQGLIRPPDFLYSRPPRPGSSTTSSQPQGGGQEALAGSAGAGSESRANEPPVIVAPLGPVISKPIESTQQGVPEFGIVGAWQSADGVGSEGGAWVTRAMLSGLSGSGTSQSLTGFSITGGIGDDPGDIAGVIGSNLGSVTQQGGADPGDGSINANWGVWNTGSISEDTGVTSFPGGAHYMFGNVAPAEAVGAKTGTFSFAQLGGTIPTANGGATATSFSYPSITIDFTSRTASISSFSWQFGGAGGDTMSMAPTSGQVLVVPGQGAGFKTDGTLTCSGITCATSTSGHYGITGAFLGPKGDHVATSVSAHAGPINAHGVRLYTCAPSC